MAQPIIKVMEDLIRKIKFLNLVYVYLKLEENNSKGFRSFMLRYFILRII